MVPVMHTAGEKGGSFYYSKDDQKLAEMTYLMAGEDIMIIDHTTVDNALKGQGVGRQLLEQLIAFVRGNNIRIIPLCPFAKATFEKTTEWQDVLA
jgi:uncharacterized protein